MQPCPTPLQLRLRLSSPTADPPLGGLLPPSSTAFTFHSYKLTVDVYLVAILCLFGITGNIVSVVVLGRDQTIRRTTGFLLQMLGLSDTAYLVTCLFYQTMNAVHDLTDWLPVEIQRRWTYLGPYTWPCASIAQTCTVWLVVVVTADRYVAICNPLHSRQHSTPSRVRATVLLVWIFSVVYNLPRFFERSAIEVSVHNQTTNTTTICLEVQKSALRNNAVYVIVYKTVLFFVVRFLLPFTALSFFNTRLIQAIRASNGIHHKITTTTTTAQFINNHKIHNNHIIHHTDTNTEDDQDEILRSRRSTPRKNRTTPKNSPIFLRDSRANALQRSEEEMASRNDVMITSRNDVMKTSRNDVMKTSRHDVTMRTMTSRNDVIVLIDSPSSSSDGSPPPPPRRILASSSSLGTSVHEGHLPRKKSRSFTDDCLRCSENVILARSLTHENMSNRWTFAPKSSFLSSSSSNGLFMYPHRTILNSSGVGLQNAAISALNLSEVDRPRTALNSSGESLSNDTSPLNFSELPQHRTTLNCLGGGIKNDISDLNLSQAPNPAPSALTRFNLGQHNDLRTLHLSEELPQHRTADLNYFNPHNNVSRSMNLSKLNPRKTTANFSNSMNYYNYRPSALCRGLFESSYLLNTADSSPYRRTPRTNSSSAIRTASCKASPSRFRIVSGNNYCSPNELVSPALADVHNHVVSGPGSPPKVERYTLTLVVVVFVFVVCELPDLLLRVWSAIHLYVKTTKQYYKYAN